VSWHSFDRNFEIPKYPIESIHPSEHLSEGFPDFSVIFAVDELGMVSMTVNGVFPLACFSESGCKQVSPNESLSQLILLKVTSEGWSFEEWDTQVLDKKSKQINEVSRIFQKTQELFKVLHKGGKEVVKEANSVLSSYIGRYLNGIEDSIEKNGGKSTVEEVLSNCAATGVVSSFLNKFLKDEMQNSKAISQYEEKLAVQVKNCQISLIQDCKNSIISLIFYLNTLKNYSKVPNFAPLNLAALDLDSLIEKLQKLLKKSMKMMELLSDAHFNIKNMIHWLHNWNLKLVKEEEQAEAPEEWQVDLKQLMIYFENESSLYFEELRTIIKSDFSNDLNLIQKEWSSLTAELPKSIPKYFRKISQVMLSSHLYSDFQMKTRTFSTIVVLHDVNRAEVFQIASGQVTSYAPTLPFPLKFLKICHNENLVIAGSEGQKTTFAQIDRQGKSQSQIDFFNEEVSALAFCEKRMVGVLVTNERTLRMFDFEDL
jgi:hypothetical protein